VSEWSWWARARADLSRRAVLAGSVAVLVLASIALFRVVKPRPRTIPIADGAGAPATVTVERADLKAEPSARARTVAKLDRGERVEVRRDAGTWLEATAGDRSGYLPVETVERDSDRGIRERRARTILSYSPLDGVVVEDADLLLAPYPMAARAGGLEKGGVIRVYSVDGAYYALKAPDGGLAFVESSKVDLVPPDPRQPAIAPSKESAPKNLSVTDLAPVTPEPGSGGDPFSGLGLGSVERTPIPGGAPAAPAEPSEAPVLLAKVEPRYPEAARRAGIEGTVVLEAWIDTDGRVARIGVLNSPSPILSDAAVAAVRLWRYRPTRGSAASRKEIRIDFRLR